MDIKPIFKNRVFQAVALTGVATAVLTVGLGYVVGKAVTIGLAVGAGYLAYKYVIQPVVEKNSHSLSKDEIRKYSNHYYDSDEVDKKVKEAMKSSKSARR